MQKRPLKPIRHRLPPDPWNMVWGGYPRISEDPNDTRAGVGRQREDIIEGVRRRGGDPDKIVWYDENDTSAYKRKQVTTTDPLGNEYTALRVIRPKWHTALHDLRLGKIDGLMAWDLDRVARDNRDLEDAVEVVELYGAPIESAVPGEINLVTDDGITNARMKVVFNNKSSRDTGRRVARAHLATARTGRPIGHRMFGWEEDRVTIRQSEAKHVHETVKLILDGMPTQAAARELNEKGVLTSRGKKWTAATLKQYLLNPRLYGVRVYHREVMLGDDGKPVRGLWEPMFDESTHLLLVDKMKRPDHRGGVISHPGSRNYLLTGLLVCSVCRGTMYGGRQSNGYGYYYSCRASKGFRDKDTPHSNYVSGDTADRMVRKLVVETITAEALAPSEHGEFHGEQRARELQDAIDATMDQIGGPIPAARLYAKINSLSDELAEIEAERKVWLTATSTPAPTQITLAELEAQDHYAQRGLIDRYLQAVIVKPPVNSSPGRTFDASRLVPIPREYVQLPDASPVE
jgi:site-specific DNA recombinase